MLNKTHSSRLEKRARPRPKFSRASLIVLPFVILLGIAVTLRANGAPAVVDGNANVGQMVAMTVVEALQTSAPDWVTRYLRVRPVNRPDGIIPASHAFAVAHFKRLLLKTFLATYGMNDADRLKAFAEIEAHMSKFLAQPKTVLNITTSDELVSARDLIEPKFWDLADELAYWRANVPPYLILTTNDADIQGELDRALDSEWRPQLKGAEETLARLEQFYIRASGHAEVFQQSLKLLPDAARLAVAHKIDDLIGAGLKKIDTIGEQVTKSGNVQLPSAVWQRFFELVLNQYFSMLDPSVKLNILGQLLDLGPNVSNLDRFEVMVINGGPQFQKLFQIYARQEGFSSSLREVFKKLEQASKPIPWRLVKPVIESAQVPFKWISVSPKPLGVGTMAQVHKATIEITDAAGNKVIKKVVVRLLKPQVKERVQQDNRAMARLAPPIDADPQLRAGNFPLITPFIEQIQEMTSREANMETTVNNQLRGAKVYNSNEPLQTSRFKGVIEFHVPEIIPLPPDSPIMVQEFIEGTSFEEFTQADPELAKASVEALATKWLEETIAGSGFFHADLHQGNLRVKKESGHVTLNLLDFGMTGQLSEDLQTKFVLFGLASTIQDPHLMAKIVWEMSLNQENKISEAQLTRLFEAEMARQVASNLPEWPAYEWVTLAVNAGIHFPIDFTTLNRGVVLLFRILEDNKSSMDVFDTIRKILLRHPNRLRKILISSHFLTVGEWKKIGLWAKNGSERAPPVPGVSTPTAGVTNPRTFMCEELFR